MAKITLKKGSAGSALQKESYNPLNELANLIGMPDLEKAYPTRNMEPWRRFNPAPLADELISALKNGTTISEIVIDETENFQLNSASKWKTTDEVFLQKARENIKKFKKNQATEFFENYITKSISDDNFFILRISKNKTYDKIPCIEISPNDSNKVCFNLFYIYCEEGSQATLNIVKNSSKFDLSIIYIYQEKNSNLNLRYLDENRNVKSHGVHFIKYVQDVQSISRSGIYNLCATSNKKLFIENKLMDSASADYSGIFLGRYSHVDHDFQIEHCGSYSKSNLLFKMSVMDDSYGIFWGDTTINAGTKGCEAYQQNKNLILGNNSRVDATPKLGIKTENVVAAHGSATGEISEEEIFYMMSRGLSYEEARRLLLHGFFEDVLRQSFTVTPESTDVFLDKIWDNIQNILGMQINT